MNKRWHGLFTGLNSVKCSALVLAGLIVFSGIWGTQAEAQSQSRKYIGRYVYYCSGDVQVTTDLYQNTMSGNHQITIAFRTGGVVALDQTPAASGVRFSDEINYVFWMKGNGAMIQVPDENGEWKTQYSDCRYDPKAAAES